MKQTHDHETGECLECGRDRGMCRLGCPNDGLRVAYFTSCYDCGCAAPNHSFDCPTLGAAEDLAAPPPEVPNARTTAGELAAQISDIVGERGSNYGPPEINFANIAAFWQAWVQARYGIMIPFDGADVGHMSALIKVARLAQTPTHRDSALDGAVYTMLGFGCALAAQEKTDA